MSIWPCDNYARKQVKMPKNLLICHPLRRLDTAPG